MPYSWVSEALDLSQMVMDIWKQLKSVYFFIPNNFSFHNITKKSFPGTPRVNALLLGVRGSGPRPDGHGLFPPIFSESVDQELSFDTLTLSLLSKLTKFHLFFLTYSNYNIDFTISAQCFYLLSVTNLVICLYFLRTTKIVTCFLTYYTVHIICIR